MQNSEINYSTGKSVTTKTNSLIKTDRARMDEGKGSEIPVTEKKKIRKHYTTSFCLIAPPAPLSLQLLTKETKMIFSNHSHSQSSWVKALPPGTGTLLFSPRLRLSLKNFPIIAFGAEAHLALYSLYLAGKHGFRLLSDFLLFRQRQEWKGRFCSSYEKQGCWIDKKVGCSYHT